MELKQVIIKVLFRYLAYEKHYSFENLEFYDTLAQRILDAIEKENK